MSGFLLLLVKGNLAMGAAIVLVSLIRRPLRAQFGAPIAYAIWLLVPIASVASLLPPREVPAHVASAPAAPAFVTAYVPTLNTIEQLARHSVITTPVKPAGLSYELFDISRLLFAAWLLGLLVMAAYLTRVQIRFSAAVRRGQAGPAVLGFFRPRIITPNGFQEQFTPQEQSAILAHERVHLARQDARINTVTAFLRCFCWFNPLIHLGARWLRIDQELACDAIAVSGAISRRDYSMALLKSQAMAGLLPFGCNWPGPQHPLVERIALLQREPPGAARRLTGMSLVLLTATSAGLGAWAAQPPVMVPPNIAAPPVAQAKESVKAAPSAIRTAGLTQQVSGATKPLSPRTAAVSVVAPDHQVPAITQSQNLIPPSADLSGLPPIDSPPTPVVLASNISPPTASNDPVQPPTSAMALNGQPASPTRDLPAGPVQAGLSTPPATPPDFDPNKPYEIRRCTGTVTGRVSSSTTIQLPGFSCGGYGSIGSNGYGYSFTGGLGDGDISFYRGRCKAPRTLWAGMASVPVPVPSCPTGFTMTVELANPADAGKMPLGKLVRLKGDFRVLIQNKVAYLLMQNARVLYADPFGR